MYIWEKIMYVEYSKLCTFFENLCTFFKKLYTLYVKKFVHFFEGFGYQMYRPYTLSNLWRKIFIHQKIVYAKYIELFTLFENLYALSIQNYVHLLRICVY